MVATVTDLFLRIPRSVRFLVIGGLAFLTHLVCVLIVVGQFAVPPLAANCLGFIAAFSLSYFGHKNWTFSAGSHGHSTAFSRFAIVAIVGFAINEGLYAVLLKVFALDYRLSLVATLCAAAASTFILSRNWAFHATPTVE
jgi:putative flippase GtrA